jgi:hypothetical protein
MRLDFITTEIERLQVQIQRQQQEILQPQRVGFNTLPGEALLARMQASVENLCAQRDRIVRDQRRQNLRVHEGTPMTQSA